MQTKTDEKRSTSTVLVENVAASTIKCTARKTFTMNGLEVNVGDDFYLVRSSSDPTRFYVVAFNNYSWTCSCGAKSKKHAHTNVINEIVKQKALQARAMQIVETPQTITEASSPVDDDLDALVAQLEKEYTPVPALAEKLPSASQTVTKNITSGRPITDLSTVGSLSSNRQHKPIIGAAVVNHMSSIERSLPSFMKRQ
jgi:hypothetical protein